MLNSSKMLTLILMAFPALSYAVNVPKNYPEDFLYQGQPIDVLCFEQALDSKVVSLKSCGIQAAKDEKIKGSDTKLIAKGFTGYDYDWQDPANPELKSSGYSYYKIFPGANDFHIVYLINSGGGSGQFSSLLLVKRQGDELKVENLGGGDRCNNGITDVKQDKQVLQYQVNLTAFDYLEFTKKNPHQLHAYDDLAACASCCLGSATFESDLSKDAESPKLVSIDLGDSYELSEQGKYQVCFNGLINDYKKQGKRYLNTKQLDQLVDDFNKTCVKS